MFSKSLTVLVLFFQIQVSDEVWSPDPNFSLEGTSKKETLIFISGISYTLTYSKKAIKEKNGNNFYCMPKDETPDSRLLLQLINDKLHGKFSAEEIITTIIKMLSIHFPCDKRRDPKGQRA